MTFDSDPWSNLGSPAGSAETTGAAPGWYPVDHLSQRYWDGYEWTNHIAPLAPGGNARFAGAVTSDDKTYALFMHLGSLFVGFLVPLIMWLVKKDDSRFIDLHGKAIMNWTLSSLIYFVVSFVLVFVLVGFFMILALILLHIIFSIMGAVAANKGQPYSYPLAIRFLS